MAGTTPVMLWTRVNIEWYREDWWQTIASSGDTTRMKWLMGHDWQFTLWEMVIVVHVVIFMTRGASNVLSILERLKSPGCINSHYRNTQYTYKVGSLRLILIYKLFMLYFDYKYFKCKIFIFIREKNLKKSNIKVT